MIIDLQNPDVHVYIYDDKNIMDITIVNHNTQEQVTIKNLQSQLSNIKKAVNETESV